MARTRKRRVMNQINVVPYIDVTLVLLVIFMVTAPMTNPGVVDLPKVGQDLNQNVTEVPIVITVKKDGSTELNGKTFSRDKLLLEIKKIQSKTPKKVVVAADEKTEFGQVAQIFDMLKVSKVEKVGLYFKPAK
ncbi:MAG TPA: biopolymer transporter ExbD [Methylotenera sp.]|nr:biopolymer transporter ExbD [Methylotenera sp.]HPH05402.1 biopolymer transporter ExbD [Methylotenera sp.]HPN01531.1 biopolymer transporter ExbD [Methylotenera sp.]